MGKDLEKEYMYVDVQLNHFAVQTNQYYKSTMVQHQSNIKKKKRLKIKRNTKKFLSPNDIYLGQLIGHCDMNGYSIQEAINACTRYFLRYQLVILY